MDKSDRTAAINIAVSRRFGKDGTAEWAVFSGEMEVLGIEGRDHRLDGIDVLRNTAGFSYSRVTGSKETVLKRISRRKEISSAVLCGEYSSAGFVLNPVAGRRTVISPEELGETLLKGRRDLGAEVIVLAASTKDAPGIPQTGLYASVYASAFMHRLTGYLESNGLSKNELPLILAGDTEILARVSLKQYDKVREQLLGLADDEAAISRMDRRSLELITGKEFNDLIRTGPSRLKKADLTEYLGTEAGGMSKDDMVIASGKKVNQLIDRIVEGLPADIRRSRNIGYVSVGGLLSEKKENLAAFDSVPGMEKELQQRYWIYFQQLR
ncbi:MAG TPA: hypothetical protein VJC03_06750, partial [bacterium]|nr:hypothetical protein [bacterium]